MLSLSFSYLFTVHSTDNQGPARKGGVTMVCEVATNERTHDRLRHSPFAIRHCRIRRDRVSLTFEKHSRLIFKHLMAIIGCPERAQQASPGQSEAAMAAAAAIVAQRRPG